MIATYTPSLRGTMPPADSSDERLMERIASGDEGALALLHDRYRAFAFAIALRVVGDAGRAEDVVQDAFLSVWRRAGSYAIGRGSVRTWLGSVVRNRAIDVIRAMRERAVEDQDQVLLSLHDTAPAVDEQVAAAIEGAETRRALGELPDEQRQAIALAYFAGLSHSEIAERTGLPLGTVKSRVRLGIQRMRQSLTVATMQA
ncbi:MAG TPA: sigma-70 family RNA polymerase sigma factor [Candidatus Limnocylindria bacterium]